MNKRYRLPWVPRGGSRRGSLWGGARTGRGGAHILVGGGGTVILGLFVKPIV